MWFHGTNAASIVQAEHAKDVRDHHNPRDHDHTCAKVNVSS